MPRNLGLRAFLRDMPELQGADHKFGQMLPPQFDGTGVVVALYPQPLPARLQLRQHQPCRFGQGAGRVQIVETVAQTHHDARGHTVKRRRKPGQRVHRLVRGKRRAAAPRNPFGFAKMQVGHAEQPVICPPQGTRAKRRQPRAAKVEFIPDVHAAFITKFARRRKGRWPMDAPMAGRRSI